MTRFSSYLWLNNILFYIYVYISDRHLFSWAPKSLWTVTEAMKLKDTYFLEEKLGQTRQHIKKQRHHFVNKGAYN